MDEESLRRFERKILRVIFGPTHEMATNECRISSNLELREDLSTSLEILSNSLKVADCDGLGTRVVLILGIFEFLR